MSDTRVCFIIACKVYRNYKSFLSTYINNINSFYSNALILLIDNNSKYAKEFYKQFETIQNVVVLENTSESKFEVGAYNFGIQYIIDNNLSFDYFVCSQDTMVLVNNFDFNILKESNTKACPIYLLKHKYIGQYGYDLLKHLNLYEENEEYFCCWCIGFVVDNESLLKLNNLTKNITTKNRSKVENFERIIDNKVYAYTTEFEASLGKILYTLNDNKYNSVEGDADLMRYNCHEVQPDSEDAKRTGHFFVKLAQNKTENTEE